MALRVAFFVLLGALNSAAALQWQQGDGYRVAPLPVPTSGHTGFTLMSETQTGLAFTNRLSQERSLTNQIYLNGSGVALGDVDGDGWCDIYLCGLDNPNVLYRNLGNWRFEDITASAGVACADQASTGAVFADVDGNGTLDLLVAGVAHGARLFLNDGKGHFHEVTQQAGLSSRAGTTSLALADIDGDGYLDLYVANYRSQTLRDEPDTRFRISTLNNQFKLLAVDGRPVTEPDLVGRFTVDPVNGVLENGEPDVLYRNDGHGRFTPLSWTDGTFLDEKGKPVGVLYEWALSVMFRDLNEDGAPDIYVCNDFHSEDRIWMNDGHGRFRAIAPLALRHTSLFSMGVDCADVDRDGHDEIFVADMLSRSHLRRQVQVSDRKMLSPPIGQITDRPQYSRNMLFWNRGDHTYAEIAQLSGVEASDWTWCPVFLDVDLDGYEDLLMITGHERDAQNIDVSRQIESLIRQKPMSRAAQLSLRRMFPVYDIPNFAFHNNGDLTFSEVGHAWGFDSRRVSQGIALADLDNDGDLDVVINCLNAPPLLYRNDSVAPRVAVRLRGTPPNTRGIGAKIRVFGGPVAQQSQEIQCGGRYLSADDAIRSFAAGTVTNSLRVEVIWRSGKRSVLETVTANREYEIDEASAAESERQRSEVGARTSEVGGQRSDTGERLERDMKSQISNLKSQAQNAAAHGTNQRDAGRSTTAESVTRNPQPATQSTPLFEDLTAKLNHTHYDEAFDDFALQPLLSRKLSQGGPGITWFDLDGDGWDDLVVASGRGGQMAAFHNDGRGGFARLNEPPFTTLATRDQTTVLGWRAGAAKPVLLVGSANYEDGLTNGPAVRQFELENKRVNDSLPGSLSSTGPLALADADLDGGLDLFVGGQVIHGRYPEAASSLLLRNENGLLRFDSKASKTLEKLGIVNGAIWSDLDGDGCPELIVACEWGPIRVFHRDGGAFREMTGQLGLGQHLGWWQSVAVGDFDGDGHLDIVAGNWGRNSRWQSFLREPLRLYAADLNGDGALEVIEAYTDPDLKKIVPWRDFGALSRVMPFIQERYHTFAQFGAASVDEILGPRRAEVNTWTASTLDSMLFLNRGNHFEARALPLEAQLAPVFGLAVADFDGDGNEDLFLSQNFFAVPPEISRYDAGRGVLLLGDGTGGFRVVSATESGIRVYGEGRGVAVSDYDRDGRVDLALGQNANATRLYRNVGGTPGLRVSLIGPSGNPQGLGAILRLEYKDGRLGPARELHAGSGYWSQDSAVQVLGKADEPGYVRAIWPGGGLSRVPVLPGATQVSVEYKPTRR